MEILKKYQNNKNLLVAEELLRIIAENPPAMKTNGIIWLTPKMIPALSINEIANCLIALERRKALKFINKEDIDDIFNDIEIFDVIPDRIMLCKFIKTARSEVYGINLKDKEWLKDVLKALYALINAKLDKRNQIKFSELGEEYIETFEYIADYSGVIKVIYELEADFEREADGRIYVLGAYKDAKSVKILNNSKIKELNKKIRKRIESFYEKQVSRLFNSKKIIEWRCVNCGRFFDTITNKKQMMNYLNDFFIDKFKICYKCRKRNYFLITQKGEIKFSLVKPKKRIPKFLKLKMEKPSLKQTKK